MSEYTEQAEKFLADAGIEFRAVLVGDDCPTFCPDAEQDRDMDKVNVFPRKTHIHGKHYRCTFSRKGSGHFSVDFWNSYRDEEENFYNFTLDWINRDNVYWDKYRGGKPSSSSVLPMRSKKTRNTPNAYDVLASIQKSDVGTFEDFCSDFGYDTDSRKAETTYHAVVKEFNKVQKFFTSAELKQAQTIQ